MTWSSYGAYLIFVILVVLAPGPDTVVTLKNTMSGGPSGGMMAVFGITVGNVLQGTAVALGLGTLIVRCQPIFLTLRWAGVAYLAYLGLHALRAARRGDYTALADSSSRTNAVRRWREGFLSNITNPKALALYLSILPQFLHPATTGVADALVLAYTFAVLGAAWLLVVLALIRRIQPALQRRTVRRGIDAVTGTALIGFGVALGLQG